MSVIKIEKHGDVAVVTINNPPVNAISHSVRLGLKETFETLEEDATVKAVVLTGEGKFFVAGADISEFGKPPKAPILPDVTNLIENCELPVVAAIKGAALGGGLELALASSHRIALSATKFGLPETTLGLIPGSGGTQRAPRLIGLANTLEMVTSGKPIPSDKAVKNGLVDEIVADEGDLLIRAIEIARDLIGKPKRRTGELENAATDDNALQTYREKYREDQPGKFAVSQAVEAVAASTSLSITDGLKQERERFLKCLEGAERRSLVHAFFAERRVNKVPEAQTGTALDVTSAGVIGGGTMGAGIAASFLLNGLSVVLIERDDEALAAGRDRIKGILDGAVKRGKLSESEHTHLLGSALQTSTSYKALSSVDLVVEAVFEDIGVKKQVFGELDKVCKPGAVLATNTSYLDINEIAASTSRPEAVIGLHFFSPAHIMKLLEIVVADRTSPDFVATGFALAKRLRKVAVRAGVCDGFIGNRILSKYRQAADYMMLDGATPYEIDNAIRSFGFPMGPYEVSDLAGLDIGWASRKRKAPTRPPEERYVTVLDRICENGWFGRKTRRGVYLYEGKNSTPDPDVLKMLDEERERAGITARSFSKEEIIRRYMAAMINEAAKVIEENIALRPSDVDVTLLYGYGFPRYRGGPTQYADEIGIDNVLHDILEYQKEDPFFWKPSELLQKLAVEKRSFADLNDD